MISQLSPKAVGGTVQSLLQACPRRRASLAGVRPPRCASRVWRDAGGVTRAARSGHEATCLLRINSPLRAILCALRLISAAPCWGFNCADIYRDTGGWRLCRDRTCLSRRQFIRYFSTRLSVVRHDTDVKALTKATWVTVTRNTVTSALAATHCLPLPKCSKNSDMNSPHGAEVKTWRSAHVRPIAG